MENWDFSIPYSQSRIYFRCSGASGRACLGVVSLGLLRPQSPRVLQIFAPVLAPRDQGRQITRGPLIYFAIPMIADTIGSRPRIRYLAVNYPQVVRHRHFLGLQDVIQATDGRSWTDSFATLPL